jgi:hypothetical protein
MTNIYMAVMGEARSLSVSMVQPTRFALSLTLRIKSIIRLKIHSDSVRNDHGSLETGGLGKGEQPSTIC